MYSCREDLQRSLIIQGTIAQPQLEVLKENRAARYPRSLEVTGWFEEWQDDGIGELGCHTRSPDADLELRRQAIKNHHGLTDDDREADEWIK